MDEITSEITNKQITDLQDQIDIDFKNFITECHARQITYLAGNGRYFQGLSTHSILPKNGGDQFADRLGDKPSDQLANWRDFFNDIDLGLPSTKCATEIITHNGPNGKGYTIRMSMQIGDGWGMKSIGQGEHSITSNGWEYVTLN